jgi:GT2 family glycosyltransferase
MAMTPASPSVAIIVVNYNGGDLTLQCLASLAALDYPADRVRVVLVDNASTDGVAARVRGEQPGVVVVDAGANLGFAGGVNLGVRHAGHAGFIGLLNPDATVDAAWLSALADALEADPGLGAVNGKVVFADRFRDVAFDQPVTVTGATVGGTDAWDRIQWAEGWLGPAYDRGRPLQWSVGPAVLRVPEGVDVVLELPPGVHQPEPGPPHDVINSAGLVVTDDTFGADRGYLEIDRGQFDEPAELDAWTGSSVLLRRTYLDAVGPLDERLFLYYEDFEHSWRGRKAGWRFAYQPRARTRHVHQASVGRSGRSDVLSERNRLIVLSRHAARRAAVAAFGRHLLVTGSYVRRDVVARVAHGRRPSFTVVGRRLRAWTGALRRAPGGLAARTSRRGRGAPTPCPRRQRGRSDRTARRRRVRGGPCLTGRRDKRATRSCPRR